MLMVELVKSLVELTGETTDEEVVSDAFEDVDNVADVRTELEVNRLEVKGAEDVTTELEVARLEVTTTLLEVATDEDEEEVATEADDEPHDQPEEDEDDG